MIVNSTDGDHLINEIGKEMPRLLTKTDSIKASLIRKYRKSREVTLKKQLFEWTNPDTKTRWVISSSFHKLNNKPEVTLYPITQFNEAGRKKYLLFAFEKLEYDFGMDDFLIKIYDGHFISRFLERNIELEFSSTQVILDFPFRDNTHLVKHYIQNVEWLLYLHKTGIAMIKSMPPIIYFDTYIHLSSIKEAQKKAIVEHLEELHSTNPVHYLTLHVLLAGNPAWDNSYFKPESIEDAILRTYDENPDFVHRITMLTERHGKISPSSKKL